MTRPTHRPLIETIHHDVTTDRLVLQFRGGATVTYLAVPHPVIEQLRHADNPDRFYMREIRDYYTRAGA